MLRSRIIPCLLVHNKGLVKTVKFKNPKYVGDPINAVKIFNEKEVDELVVLDIDASVEGREPDYSLIEKLAIESLPAVSSKYKPNTIIEMTAATLIIANQNSDSP